jgi:hypothetical protein
MIDWILAGVLAAVLAAEVVDAWALHHLVRRCAGIQPKTNAERRLVLWYAEGFDHSRLLTGWLRAASIALTILCMVMAVHPILVLGSLLLAVGAHCERCASANLRRRFFRGEYRRRSHMASAV